MEWTRISQWEYLRHYFSKGETINIINIKKYLKYNIWSLFGEIQLRYPIFVEYSAWDRRAFSDIANRRPIKHKIYYLFRNMINITLKYSSLGIHCAMFYANKCGKKEIRLKV